MQIHTSIQHATVMVNSFPKPVDPNKVLELVAQRRNEPSVDVLMSNSRVDDLQHAANWETVKEYFETLNPSNVHVHCPFLRNTEDNQS